jgi:hypothetical protein
LDRSSVIGSDSTPVPARSFLPSRSVARPIVSRRRNQRGAVIVHSRRGRKRRVVSRRRCTGAVIGASWARTAFDQQQLDSGMGRRFDQ